MSHHLFGLDEPVSALVIGGREGIGGAVVNALLADRSTESVTVTSRNASWVEQAVADSRVHRRNLDVTKTDQIVKLADELGSRQPGLNVILNCTGVLHTDGFGPERSWRHLDMDTMQQVFAVNTFGVALTVRYLLPLLPRDRRAIFASISARVGSIGDNRLGGWYSYRASKAAQNMVIRTGAIEAKRTRPKLVCVALHPGTVRTALSDPFTKRKADDEIFSPSESGEHLISVLTGLSGKDSGYHFAWDGERIPW